jgi:hypothetical protein
MALWHSVEISQSMNCWPRSSLALGYFDLDDEITKIAFEGQPSSAI